MERHTKIFKFFIFNNNLNFFTIFCRLLLLMHSFFKSKHVIISELTASLRGTLQSN